MVGKRERSKPYLDIGSRAMPCACYSFVRGADADCTLCKGVGYLLIVRVEPNSEYL